MPPVVRLNRNDLIEWIEAKEAEGGDATELRRALEELGLDLTRVPGHARVDRAQDLTTKRKPTLYERLNNRVGDIFAGGLSDDLLANFQ